MAQNTFETIKRYLLRQQQEVEENLKSVQKDDAATAPALAESSEPGTDSWVADSHTRTLALVTQLRRMGTNIRKALTKIKIGTYGKCERCGSTIDTNRLMAMPTADLCLSCSAKSSS